MNKAQAAKIYARAELARREFWAFCLFYDREFFKQRAFLKDVAQALQAIDQGEIKSLAVNMPPRAGKSYITSLFCAWCLGRNPRESVMRNTCTAHLYQKFSYDVRSIVKTDIFRLVFPNVRLSDDKSNLNGWNTNTAKMVSYFGAGVGGTIIGFGASKVAITDDLYRGLEDALSDTVNDRIIQWKQATHDSRFETGCARVDIGTRWSINDIIGKQMADGIYDRVIIIPALNQHGKSFCEAVMSTAEYEAKRAKMTKEIWLAEYMQEPVDLEGRLFANFKTVTPAELNALQDAHGVTGCLAYCDVADQGKDFTALAIAAVINKEIYLVETLYTRDNTDVTIPQAAALLDKWNVSYCRVESNAMGAMFSRHLQKATKARILQVNNQANKMTRIIMQSAFILNEFNFVQYNTPQHLAFIDNVLSFSKEGKNKHDDAPDCLAGLAMFLQAMIKKM